MEQKATKKTKTQLIVEKSDGELWGRIKIKGDLIADSAPTLSSLQKQLKQLALDFEGVEITEFEVSYDLTSFFTQYSFLNISDVAKKAGVSAGLMRQYASGTKYPSEERVKEIESAIHLIGKELLKVKLHKPQKALA
jgi:transcriptional regulator with XRE-family HTH domain